MRSSLCARKNPGPEGPGSSLEPRAVDRGGRTRLYLALRIALVGTLLAALLAGAILLALLLLALAVVLVVALAVGVAGVRHVVAAARIRIVHVWIAGVVGHGFLFPVGAKRGQRPLFAHGVNP